MNTQVNPNVIINHETTKRSKFPLALAVILIVTLLALITAAVVRTNMATASDNLSRASRADAARLSGLAQRYQASQQAAALDAERADAARWNAQAEFYAHQSAVGTLAAHQKSLTELYLYGKLPQDRPLDSSGADLNSQQRSAQADSTRLSGLAQRYQATQLAAAIQAEQAEIARWDAQAAYYNHQPAPDGPTTRQTSLVNSYLYKKLPLDRPLVSP